MLFGGNMVRTDHLVIPWYMVPVLTISGHYDDISKKFQKLLNLWFLVSDLFFRNKYVLIVISIGWTNSCKESENLQFRFKVININFSCLKLDLWLLWSLLGVVIRDILWKGSMYTNHFLWVNHRLWPIAYVRSKVIL